MREPIHAANVIGAMVKAVKIPVTVKMRAGWSDRDRNAPELARRLQDTGAAAVTIHGRTAEQMYKGNADWDLVADIASQLDIPVFGSGDCIEPLQVVQRLRAGLAGVLVGRGILRNPWILAQASDLVAGVNVRKVTMVERGAFLLEYIDLLLNENLNEVEGFRHFAPSQFNPSAVPARGREKWVINKLRALCSWYSKGLKGGSQLRVRVNSATSIKELRLVIQEVFFAS
jgi:tRNA-dihydrouridine synthase B